MKCLFCGHTESKVIDSRATDEASSIRRRRECLNCGKRFTTYEYIETTPVLVIKSDGTRQPFDPQKIKRGIVKACEKRPITIKQIDDLVADIEKQVYNSLEQEIKSSKIGEIVMESLKALDEVAYIRFASVYKNFEGINSFATFLKDYKK
ncbi:MAG: transcriptional regulator NrdR [Clostridia bacterium]|jgi:transcriptional repressor NrdR|nr:transcriptional regulator NrdR [Clostridia bacterium]MDD4275964.1 transcriptional regulator NrdR [Clostridia bacterium]